MSHADSRSKLFERTFCLVLFFVAAAASFNGFYGKWHFREAGTSQFLPGASFDTMLDGTANRPFVYRQLVPMMANWIDARLTQKTKDAVIAATDPNGAPILPFFLDSPISRDRRYALRYAIVYVAVFLFAWIAVYAMYLVGKSAGYAPATAAFAAIAMILLIPYFMTWGGYFYDYVELAFFALVFWMALKFDWWWIIPIAALATWNKESFLFFIPTLYPLLRRRNSRASALVGIAVIGFAGALVELWIRLRFQHNPGATVQFHLMEHVHYLWHPLDSIAWEKTYGVVVLQSYHPFTLALIAWIVWRGWRHLPGAMQRHAQIALVMNFPLYILFCLPGELRDLSMLYLTFCLLLAANLTEWQGKQIESAAPQAA